MIKTYQGTVYPWQCDHMGHMNVQFYVEKFDQATWNLCGYFGLTSTYLKENNKGLVALEQHIYYKKEILAGTNVMIESEMNELNDKTMLFSHYLINLETKEVAATTDLTGLHMDTQIRKGHPFPQFAIDNINEYLTKKQEAAHI